VPGKRLCYGSTSSKCHPPKYFILGLEVVERSLVLRATEWHFGGFFSGDSFTFVRSNIMVSKTTV